MKLFRILLIFSALVSLAHSSTASANGPAAFLHKIDRQLCAEFKRLKCHGKRQKNVVPKRKIAKPSVAVQTPITPQPTIKSVINSPMQVPAKAAAVLPTEKPMKVTPVPPAVAPVNPPASVAIEQPSDASCFTALTAKLVDFDSVAQPSGSPSCMVVQPVQLKSVLVNGATVQLPDHPIFKCTFALAFVSWLQDLGGPAALAQEGTALTQFWTGPGYQCRGRNGDISAKISEHGFGNAVDIERLKFSDGLMVLVHDAPDSSAPGYEVLKAIRASACSRFTTVLGPGANEAHREHFHFDLGQHGKSGTYRICE